MHAIADHQNLAQVTLTAIPGQPNSSFSYDAVEEKKQRKAPKVDHRSEDLILDAGNRAKMTANGRDIARNFAIAMWMVRRHLDYTTQFVFHGRTKDKDFNNQLERLMAKRSERENCDIARRHRLSRMTRMWEIRRVLEGDVGIIRQATAHLQSIEGDRIKNPTGEVAGVEWTHGIRLDGAGAAQEYAIWKRSKAGGMTFDKRVPASRMFLLGYFDRFDQVRGISPLATAFNPIRDVYEGVSYALLKSKVEQFFGLVIKRDALEAIGEHTYTGDETDCSASVQKNKYNVDLGRGPIKLEIDKDEEALFLQSQNPSNQFQSFTQLVLQIALKALDIPFSFYDEAHTNFFGSRAAWLHYDRSCMSKREDILELLKWITRWWMTLWILDGELILPRGWTLDDALYEWVPTGMPWWDPAKEIRGELMAIMAGLDNPQHITKSRSDGDFYDNVDKLAEAVEYARSKGVKLSFDPGPDPLEVTKENE